MITGIIELMGKIFKTLIMGVRTSYIINMALLIISLLAIAGCAPMRPAVINTYNDSIFNYKYFYISPTGNYTSRTGIYGNQYGVYGGSTKSINPATIISGILFKNGFIQVNEVNPNNAKETMIVNFGETGRRNVNLGYSIEITIQFVSASTQYPICSCTAEGQGETEADDIRKAIRRALDPLFKTK